MALPYFYQAGIGMGSSVVLSEETSKHCIQVLRMKVGELLQLTDGKGNAYKASIRTSDKRHCEVLIEETSFEEQATRKVCMGISLLKNASRLEWFLEKATEMGVAEIVPLICHRTERQHFRMDRMQNIVVAAMLQSQQVWLPILHEPIAVEKVIANASQAQKLIAHCEDGLKQTIKELPIDVSVQMLIGPEGDFTTEEIAMALQNGYKAVSLGNTRLRTETAGIVATCLLVNA